MIPEGIKIICCDYYMTLVGLENPFNLIKSWLYTYLENHYPLIKGNEFFSKFNRNRAKLTAHSFRLGIDLLAESLSTTCKHYNIIDFSEEFVSAIEDIFRKLEPYPDAYQFIDIMKGKYVLGLLTNADNYILQQSIKRFGFNFNFIITSEDAKSNKPNEEFYKYAMNKLGSNGSNILMIGDSQIDDIYGAGNMGMKTIWVNRSQEQLKSGIPAPILEVTSLKQISDLVSGREYEYISI